MLSNSLHELPVKHFSGDKVHFGAKCMLTTKLPCCERNNQDLSRRKVVATLGKCFLFCYDHLSISLLWEKFQRNNCKVSLYIHMYILFCDIITVMNNKSSNFLVKPKGFFCTCVFIIHNLYYHSSYYYAYAFVKLCFQDFSCSPEVFLELN